MNVALVLLALARVDFFYFYFYILYFIFFYDFISYDSTWIYCLAFYLLFFSFLQIYAINAPKQDNILLYLIVKQQ